MMATLDFAAGAVGALWREKRWDRARLLAFRDGRLRALVEHARAHSPLWRRRLVDVPPVGPVELSRVPPLTKAELRGQLADALAVPGQDAARLAAWAMEPGGAESLKAMGLLAMRTSGTTGEVATFIGDVRSFDRMRGLIFARTLRHRLGPGDVFRFGPWRRYRMGFIVAMGGPYVTWMLTRDEPPAAAAMMKQFTWDVELPLDALCAELDRARPHFLHGYATSMEALAHAQLQGRLHISPEFMSTGSEALTPSARDVLRRAFPRTQLCETYGATECAAMAAECLHGTLHLNEDACILEPVDERDRPVPDGTPGHAVLLTSLVNRVQPLLRYRLADVVTLVEGGACACGSPLRGVRVEGRADDVLLLPDDAGGVRRHGPIAVEAVMLGIPGLGRFQVVQRARGALDVHVEALPGSSREDVVAATRVKLRGYLERHGSVRSVVVDVSAVDALLRDPGSHKLRQVVALPGA